MIIHQCLRSFFFFILMGSLSILNFITESFFHEHFLIFLSFEIFGVWVLGEPVWQHRLTSHLNSYSEISRSYVNFWMAKFSLTHFQASYGFGLVFKKSDIIKVKAILFQGACFCNRKAFWSIARHCLWLKLH